MKLLSGVRADAVLSDDLKYRYVLTRDWDHSLTRIVFIMLNPSTADADIDDQTLRKCQGFARMWRFGALTVVNLFALRATDPDELVNHQHVAVGPENDEWLRRTIREQDGPLVAAWGHRGSFLGRDRIVSRMADIEWRRLYRIGPPTQRGAPKHPGRLSYALPLQSHP